MRDFEIKVYIDVSAYPTRPSDTATKVIIYPLSHWWKDYSNRVGTYFGTLPYG